MPKRNSKAKGSSTKSQGSSDRPPDTESGATAKARKLRFRRKPKTKVELEGGTRVRSDDRMEEVELETDSGSEGRKPPEEAEPGVTYRDVEIGWAVRARARASARRFGRTKR